MAVLKKLLSVLAVVVGLGVISWIVWQAGVENVYNIFLTLRLDWFVLAMFAALIWGFFRILRWQNILYATGARFIFKKLSLVGFTGFLIDNATPIYRAGSEPIRALLLQKHLNIEPGVGWATVIIDRFFDFGAYLSLAIIAMIILPMKVKMDPAAFSFMLFAIIFLIGVLCAVIYFSLSKKALYKISSGFIKFIGKSKRYKQKAKRWRGKLEGQIELYSRTLRSGFFINALMNVLLSIILIGVEIVRVQLIVLSLGLSIDFFWIIIAMGAVIISGILPSPPGGVGIVEPVGIAAFTVAGLTLGQATAVILLDRIINLGFISLVGAGCYLKLGQMSQKNTH